ncbi:hypothetical protein ACFYQT_40300 [Streptomyces tibetensis]|uniref:Uncharacterized protein n=1 Tax=Streptomyces tibetensis TaxID=2382123 RepID=A0ABW6NCV6_9ACTN
MTTTSIETRAVRGRRVTYAYTSDKTQRPGVITDTKTAVNGTLLAMVRLDGARSSLHVPADHENLTYLDEIGEVPELPMGRFHPATTSLGFDFQYDGVVVCGFEDGDAVAVTADRAKAEAAIATFLREVEGIDDEPTVRESLGWMKPRWVVFEWEPEDAEFVWLMNPASEGDDQAVHVYYLPA